MEPRMSGLWPQGTPVICPSGGLLTGLPSHLFRIFRKIFVAT